VPGFVAKAADAGRAANTRETATTAMDLRI